MLNFKFFGTVFFTLFIVFSSHARSPFDSVKRGIPSHTSIQCVDSLSKKYALSILHPKSKVDKEFTEVIALLLPYFPELKGARLRIRSRKQVIPLTTVPAFGNLFRSKKNYTIRINISSQTRIDFLNPILYKNLSDSGKIGVLGHELSHAKDFYTHKRRYILAVFFAHVSKKKIDRFEFETDHTAIKQGLGEYLLAWKVDVEKAFAEVKPTRSIAAMESRERYMRSETVKKYMGKYSNKDVIK
ncbi:MAG: hypothetical protein ACRCVT_01805 [Leadbetterella sp.]